MHIVVKSVGLLFLVGCVCLSANVCTSGTLCNTMTGDSVDPNKYKDEADRDILGLCQNNGQNNVCLGEGAPCVPDYGGKGVVHLSFLRSASGNVYRAMCIRRMFENAYTPCTHGTQCDTRTGRSFIPTGYIDEIQRRGLCQNNGQSNVCLGKDATCVTDNGDKGVVFLSPTMSMTVGNAYRAMCVSKKPYDDNENE